MLTDVATHRPILVENRGRLGAELGDERLAVPVGVLGASEHPRERPRQVHRRGTRGAYRRRGGSSANEDQCTRILRVRRKDRDEPHRSRDADRRRTSHSEGSNGIQDVIEGAQLALDETTGKLPLIDDTHAETVVGPPDRLNDVHAEKLVNRLA